MRASGILLPIFSLPSKYGIGCFSKEAYWFIDQLAKAKQSYWQILPLGPTGYGDSPYQSFSSYAGNPYFIDLDALKEEGLLLEEECLEYEKQCSGRGEICIDYEFLYQTRFVLLKKAFVRYDSTNKEFQNFIEIEKEWLDGYSLYMAIKDKYEGISLEQWPDVIRKKEKVALDCIEDELQEEVLFYKFLQFEFMEQWNTLHQYARKKGIKIIGDIPIYVAYDSSDTWDFKELFQLDEELIPIEVAGCPPDAFSETGQLWGNPLYHWEAHRSTEYDWWVKRIEHCFRLYDVVRIDHFRGFDEYYSIPFGEKTAQNGKWKKGPGMELFHAIYRKIGKVDIIAEDLGFLTESVVRLLKDSTYPGMKVLQFAFDSREESNYLPHTYDKNCVVYTGTHDNDTIMGWFQVLKEEDKRFALDYLGLDDATKLDINWDFIRLALESVAELCIIPLQDYLGEGTDSRINTPSTLGNNWRYRMRKEALTEEIIEKIAKNTTLYGRGLK